MARFHTYQTEGATELNEDCFGQFHTKNKDRLISISEET